jgi:hypothetical protein
MKKPKHPNTQRPKDPTPHSAFRVPRSLEEVQAACVKLIQVPVFIGGQTMLIPVRPLASAESEQIQLLLAEVAPPLVRSEKGEVGSEKSVDRYDLKEPGYLKKMSAQIQLTRALGLYWCCPLFAQSRPGLTDRAAIAEFVAGVWTEGVKELLWQVILSDGRALEEMVNFTLPPG